MTEITTSLPRLMNQKDLCDYLGKSEAWAERARLEGTGPRFIRCGRSVRYRLSDVEEWLNVNTRKSTSHQTAT